MTAQNREPGSLCERCRRCAGCHAETGGCPVPNTSCVIDREDCGMPTLAYYEDTYPLDDNGYVAVSRPLERIPAAHVKRDDILILDSGLSRVTGITSYQLDNGVAVLHITGPTNIVRANYEVVTVLRSRDGEL